MEITKDHIIPYLEGSLPVEQVAAFEHLAESSPEFRQEIKEIQFIWNATENLKKQRLVNTDAHWNKLARQMRFLSFRQKLWDISRNAAAILILPLFLVTIYLMNDSIPKEESPINQVELQTAYGLVSKVILPDGSEVWLNSGTKITYPERFTGKHRTVKLEGEAYFKVTSDKTNRFDVVVPNGMTVSAYGTEFNVSAYNDDNKIEAILAKGNIDVKKYDTENVFSLKAGEQAVLNKTTRNITISEANIYTKTAWSDGKMVFRRAGFDEIVRKLSRHFNVSIELQGKTLHEYEYSATFTTETLPEVLRLLEKSAPIRCQILDSEINADYTYAKRRVIIREYR